MTTEDTTNPTDQIEETQGDVVEEITTVEEPTEYKYEFEDGAKFKTQEEALNYAKTLLDKTKLELEVTNARQQGFQEAISVLPPVQNVTPQQQAPAFDKDAWAAKFYEDPHAALEAERERIRNEVLSTVRGELTQSQTEAEVWNQFTSRYPDLINFKDDVNAAYAREKQLVDSLAKARGMDAAYKYLATKVREKFNAYVEATKPRKELPRTPTHTPGSTQTNVTPPKTPQKVETFSQQMAKLNAQRRGLA